MATHSGIRDDGLRFQIVPSTRKITVPASHKVIGTVGDHMSEQITIMCPLTIDGHDIMGCARKFITWKNVSGDVGHDELVFIEKDEEYAYFTWTIRDGLTVASGMVQFSVHFEDTDDSGVVVYRWSTAPCTDCEILDSVNAVLGAYKAIYVAGDTLVIADYNPVKDGTLSLDSAGIIPSGTLEITEEGEYDVGQYAAVNVTVPGLYEDPTIEVDESTGLITATANGKESTAQVVIPSCTVTATITGVTGIPIALDYMTAEGLTINRVSSQTMHPGNSPVTFNMVKGYFFMYFDKQYRKVTVADCVRCALVGIKDNVVIMFAGATGNTASFTINMEFAG